jgi:hypothetical protein
MDFTPAIFGILLLRQKQEDAMAEVTGKTTKPSDLTVSPEAAPHSAEIDRMAPAGSKNSLGAQSVRDGRPATDDSVVEAMDEEGPGITPLPTDKTGSNQ